MRNLLFFFSLLFAAQVAAQVGPLEQTQARYTFFSGHRSPVYVDSTGTAFVKDAAGQVIEYNAAVHAEATAYPCTFPGCNARRQRNRDRCSRPHGEPLALIHHPARQ